MLVDADSYRAVDRQSWLKSHMKFLNNYGVATCQIRNELQDIRQLIVVRDCITHANGEIALSKRPCKVSKATKAIEGAGEFADGYISLDDQVIPLAHQ